MYITKHLYVTLLKVFECIIGSSLRFSFTCVIIVTNSKYAATAQDHPWSALSSCCESCSVHAIACFRDTTSLDCVFLSRPRTWILIRILDDNQTIVLCLEESKLCQTTPNQEILHCQWPHQIFDSDGSFKFDDQTQHQFQVSFSQIVHRTASAGKWPQAKYRAPSLVQLAIGDDWCFELCVTGHSLEMQTSNCGSRKGVIVKIPRGLHGVLD